MRNVDVKTQTMDSECLGEERGKSTARNLLIDGYCALCSEGLEQEEQEVIDCSEIVQCYFCKDSFHAINCKDDSCNVSATSVFKNQLSPAVNNTSSYERRFGRFLFMCDDCITLEEKKRASATADRVQLLAANGPISGTIFAVVSKLLTFITSRNKEGIINFACLQTQI